VVLHRQLPAGYQSNTRPVSLSTHRQFPLGYRVPVPPRCAASFHPEQHIANSSDMRLRQVPYSVFLSGLSGEGNVSISGTSNNKLCVVAFQVTRSRSTRYKARARDPVPRLAGMGPRAEINDHRCFSSRMWESMRVRERVRRNSSSSGSKGVMGRRSRVCKPCRWKVESEVFISSAIT
jgi:hypothetical protein